ncbi:MAG: VWA domain-containing protein [Bryobacteraceae bacterium]|jgi:Ca-activated chloride channel family protein
MRVVLIFVLTALGCAAESIHPGPVLEVNSDLVLVPVSVTDNRGRPVENLRAADFRLEEDKSPQEVTSFTRENAPISVGIVLDLSGSMADKVVKARIAVNQFLENLESDDEALLVTFSGRPELRSGFTSDISPIRSLLPAIAASGGTALFDAVAMALNEMRSARNERRVLMVISDGGDNSSRFSERELRAVAQESDVQIDSIGIHDHPVRAEEIHGPWILDDLADMTGGQHYTANNVTDLPDLAARISLSLHDRYLLGYRPAPPGMSGTYRRIDVKVRQPKTSGKLYVHARRGYRLP